MYRWAAKRCQGCEKVSGTVVGSGWNRFRTPFPFPDTFSPPQRSFRDPIVLKGETMILPLPGLGKENAMFLNLAILYLCFAAQSDCVVDSVEFTGHTDANMGVSLSPDGRYLASCSRDGTIRLWDIQSRKSISILKSREFWASNVVFSPDGRNLAGSYSDGAIYLWDVR